MTRNCSVTGDNGVPSIFAMFRERYWHAGQHEWYVSGTSEDQRKKVERKVRIILKTWKRRGMKIELRNTAVNDQ